MTNPFSRRGPKKQKRASATGAVHHSFWWSLQAKGFAPTDASLAAWALIKAAHPVMPGSSEALDQVTELSLAEQREMLEMVEKAKRSPRMTDPERQAVLGRVESYLRLVVVGTAFSERVAELTTTGMTPSDAAAQARLELGVTS